MNKESKEPKVTWVDSPAKSKVVTAEEFVKSQEWLRGLKERHPEMMPRTFATEYADYVTAAKDAEIAELKAQVESDAVAFAEWIARHEDIVFGKQDYDWSLNGEQMQSADLYKLFTAREGIIKK